MRRSLNFSYHRASKILSCGGIIAYPTEAVFGLGCDPYNRAAVERIYQIKQRRGAKQFILIADTLSALRPLLGDIESYPTYAEMIASWPGPHTWICPAADHVPKWLCSKDRTLAVRVTAHPGAAELCRVWGSPLVSTSANRSGHHPLRSALRLMKVIGPEIDYLVPGSLGGLTRPTSIRVLRTGLIIRP